MNLMNRLTFLRNGKVRRRAYNEPELEIFAVNAQTNVVILRRKGYSANYSGIRGLRDDHYNPMSYFAFQLVGSNYGDLKPDDEINTELLIEWTHRGNTNV